MQEVAIYDTSCMTFDQLTVESSVEGTRRVLLIRQFDMTEGFLPR